MLKIGLTGGIGCGKSTVAALFQALGVPVLDADQIARELVEPGQPALEAIVNHFGPGIVVAGKLDRARLRQLVFAAPEQRRWLESLLHPLIYAELERRLASLSGPYCLLVIPLLLESGRRSFVDRVLVVDCPEPVQRQRVKSRDGMSDAEVDRLLAAQLGREERLRAADDVIENAGAPESLPPQVEQLHRAYLALREQGPRLPSRIGHDAIDQ
ncbi:dephospho-CoA kinase [Candidatus Methylocalor cossyra]|uniref:Dephospho-CoA kinase n=1 Tax=Candidatus Methylocalor cossyra TaxID=3108543 RepID=A0ABP1C4U6_9GAMM